MSEVAPGEWLLFVYRVPTEPSRMRTYVWRQIKAMGAIHLEGAIWLLPRLDRLAAELESLAAKIEGFGGECSLLTTVSPTPVWQERVINGFNQARNEEYAEIVENEERFEDEIRRETRKGKFTFAELEEVEAEWERLKRWLERVRDRDFFAAPGSKEAETRLAEGERMLAAFAQRVYEHEQVADSAEERSGQP